MNAPLRLVLCALFVVAACADVDPHPALAGRASALARYVASESVYVLDSGHYGRPAAQGASSESFWIDLNVRNDSPVKQVGVVWSRDGWQSFTTTAARYEANLGGGRERWGVDVLDFATLAAGQAVEVEYAAYVTVQGRTSWSALRNHYVYGVVTPQRPVRLLASSVAGQRLQGVVRALNVPSARRVFVRFTTDGWASFDDAEAQFDGRDFAFDLALPLAPVADRVEFAVRLEAEGETHWDNHGGQNYAHALAPTCDDSFETSGASFCLDPEFDADGALVRQVVAYDDQAGEWVTPTSCGFALTRAQIPTVHAPLLLDDATLLGIFVQRCEDGAWVPLADTPYAPVSQRFSIENGYWDWTRPDRDGPIPDAEVDATYACGDSAVTFDTCAGPRTVRNVGTVSIRYVVQHDAVSR